MTTSPAIVRPHSLTPATSAKSHPVVRGRIVVAGVLTAVSAVIAVALVVALGAFGVVVAAVSLGLPLLLTWSATDTLRSDEA